VAGAFQRARAVTVAAAQPASPGAIWWRAQLRSRQQAFSRIERPLIGAQVFALVALLLPIIGFAAFEVRNLPAWLGKISQSAQLHAGSAAASSLSGSASGLVFVVVAAAAFALIASVAVYFATERK
jgi:hypothetical protein